MTYAEIVVVLLLIAVLTSIAVPIYTDGIDGYRVEAAARRIVADLERARRDAKLTGVTREVIFKVANNRYDVIGMTDPDNPHSALYRVELDATPYPASLVSVVFTDAGGVDDNIEFDMYSRPSTPGGPLLGGAIVVQSGNEQRTVIIEPVTGRARVQ